MTSFMNKKVLSSVLTILTCLLADSGYMHAESRYWNFPPLPPPHQYGNILINRISDQNNVQPVFFSHWSHRVKYSCRVCHLELGFAFEVNTTQITEENSRNGLFCGAAGCHDGKTAFGHTRDHCGNCHTGTVDLNREKFDKVAGKLPRGYFGNEIDWVKAVEMNKITPLYSLFKSDETPLPFTRRLELEATWNFVPPAVFSHGSHVQWLDCANCHPDIFNIKKKTTKNFAMKYILEKKFCGVCHMQVAFPLNDCKRCHPDMIRND